MARAKAATAKQQRANALARQAGFRNDYDYRTAQKTIRPGLRDEIQGVRGEARRSWVALATNRARLPGRPGSRQRARAAARLAQAIREAGGDPDVAYEAVGSPRRRGR